MNFSDFIEWKISVGTILHMIATLSVVAAFGFKLTVIGVEIRAKVNEIWGEWKGTEHRDSMPVRLAKAEHKLANIENRAELGDWAQARRREEHRR